MREILEHVSIANSEDLCPQRDASLTVGFIPLKAEL